MRAGLNHLFDDRQPGTRNRLAHASDSKQNLSYVQWISMALEHRAAAAISTGGAASNRPS